MIYCRTDHVKPGGLSTPDSGRAFIERISLRTLARAEQLAAEKKVFKWWRGALGGVARSIGSRGHCRLVRKRHRYTSHFEDGPQRHQRHPSSAPMELRLSIWF
jgi:hypothetical protein